jgi:hypothetical protein
LKSPQCHHDRGSTQCVYENVTAATLQGAVGRHRRIKSRSARRRFEIYTSPAHFRCLPADIVYEIQRNICIKLLTARRDLSAALSSSIANLNQSFLSLLSQRKRTRMTIENNTLRETLREELCAWMKSPPIGLPDYSADPRVQRRVGRMLANFDAKSLRRAKENLAVNSLQNTNP